MTNPELEKYVDTSLKSNMDVANIRRILISAGWNPQDVDDTIAAQTGPQKPTPGPGVAVTSPDAVVAATPETPASVVPAEPKKGLSSKVIAIAASALVVLLLAGGVGFAFYTGALSLGGGLSDAELLARLPDNLQSIKSATYEGTFDFVSEPREANAAPFIASDYYTQKAQPALGLPEQPTEAQSTGTLVDVELEHGSRPPAVSFLQYIDEYYAQIPSDISVRVTAGGSTLSQNASSTDATFHAGAEVKLADFNVSADADFLKKDSNMYFRLNKFPSLFIDLSALKGKWVVLTPEDLGGSGGWFGLFDPSEVQDFMSESRKENSGAMDQLRLVYRIAGEEGLVINSAPANSEKLDGKNTRHFRLTLAKEKVPGFYARAARELKDKYGEEAFFEFDQETADYLASPEFSKLMDYLTANTSFDVWLDPKTGQLAKYSYSLRVVPPPKVEKLKDIQYSLRISLALKDINEPQAIEAPAGAMSLEDTEILLSGKSREEVLAGKQVDNVSSIRNALETYQIYAKKYPDTLDALMITYTDLYKMDPSETDPFASSLKLLNKVPVDAYTKKPYNYRKDGADYVIEYVVNVPEGNTDSALQEVVNGTNHATSKTISTEKKP